MEGYNLLRSRKTIGNYIIGLYYKFARVKGSYY